MIVSKWLFKKQYEVYIAASHDGVGAIAALKFAVAGVQPELEATDAVAALADEIAWPAHLVYLECHRHSLAFRAARMSLCRAVVLMPTTLKVAAWTD